MLSYLNDVKVKEKFVTRMQDHIDADELIRNVGFENGRGCAVGCTLNRYDPNAFENELGIPEWIAHIIDFIHDNASNDVWPSFALDFLNAVPVGKDLDCLKAKINIFILKLNKKRVESLDYLDEKIRHIVLSSINKCIELHNSESAAESAWSAARSAAWSAEYRASSTAWSAEYSARSAAWSTRPTSWSTRSAARSLEVDLIANYLLDEIKGLDNENDME